MTPSTPIDKELDRIILDLMGCSEGDESIYREDITYVDAMQAFNSHLRSILDEVIMDDETLGARSEFDMEHFGYVSADAQPNLQYIRQATRNHYRGEQRKIAAKYLSGKETK